MEKIENPKEYEVCAFDGVNSASVYLGSFDYLQKADLEWKKEFIESMGMELETLTLDEIKEQIREKYCMSGNFGMITIFINSPLHGEILQYGNYGDSWYQIGETCGYA